MATSGEVSRGERWYFLSPLFTNELGGVNKSHSEDGRGGTRPAQDTTWRVTLTADDSSSAQRLISGCALTGAHSMADC